MSKLDDLLKSENTNLPLTTRYTKEHLAEYETDLKHIVKKIKAGACIPALHDLVAYFKDERQITVSEGTVRRHIRKLQAGYTTLWPK